MTKIYIFGMFVFYALSMSFPEGASADWMSRAFSSGDVNFGSETKSRRRSTRVRSSAKDAFAADKSITCAQQEKLRERIRFERQVPKLQTRGRITLLLCSDYSTAHLAKPYKNSKEVWTRFYEKRFGKKPNCKKKNSCGQEVPLKPLAAALSKAYELGRKEFTSKKYMFIVDYTQHCGRKRGYLLNQRTGAVKSYYVAHANPSEPWYGVFSGVLGRPLGRPIWFSNTGGSSLTTLGLMKTGRTETQTRFWNYGLKGAALRKVLAKHDKGKRLIVDWMERLDKGRDRRARSPKNRVILFHGHYAVDPKYVEGPFGCFSAANISSLGCFSLRPKDTNEVIDYMSGGQLVYVFGG